MVRPSATATSSSSSSSTTHPPRPSAGSADHHNNDNQALAITGWDRHANRGATLRRRLQQHGFRPHRQTTTLTRFRYRLHLPGHREPQWRTATALLNLPRSIRGEAAIQREIHRQLLDLVEHHPERLITQWSKGTPDPSEDTADVTTATATTTDGVSPHIAEDGHAVIRILGENRTMNWAELVERLGVDPGNFSLATTPLFGDVTSFSYMIPGCDMAHIHPLVDNDHCHIGKPFDDPRPDCDNMCAYRMIRDLGVRQDREDRSRFPMAETNRWFHDNGHAHVGGLTDGLTTEDIRFHAEAHRYPHCALDITHSLISVSIPDDPDENLKAACYVVVGKHCKPITGAPEIKSILKYARKNPQPSHSQITPFTPTATRSRKPKPSATTHPKRRAHLGSGVAHVRTFGNAFRSGRSGEEEEEKGDGGDGIEDMEGQDPVEFEEMHRGFERPSNPSRWFRDKKDFPLFTQEDRFHFFLQQDQDLILAKCHPGYQEGENHNAMHYYICLDADNIEFLYEYCVRKIKLDPLTKACSYQGHCRHLCFTNVRWMACPHFYLIKTLHTAFWPTEPFQAHGLAPYAFRLLYQEMLRLDKDTGALWEALSHYPPSLQRLLDSDHPFHRPKLSQKTYHPPYSHPHGDDPTRKLPSAQRPPVRTLIPEDQRRRIDIIRSYASVLMNMGNDEQFPIHDPTNQLVPYDEALHGYIPVGHYLVSIPTAETLLERPDGVTLVKEWSYLPCLTLGQPRVMTQIMLRRLLALNLLTKGDIRLVCPTNKLRQKQFGHTLVLAFRGLVQTVYTHPALQKQVVDERPDDTPEMRERKTMDPKHIVNHLIGLCNGTTLPRSGGRYVLEGLPHLLGLVCSIQAKFGEDRGPRFRIQHEHGHDPHWDVNYDYYRLDGSGTTYRHCHLQPVYTVVLEKQAMTLYETARLIPPEYLIQLNIDAIEYRVALNPVVSQSPVDPHQTLITDTYHPKARPTPPWVQQLAQQTHRHSDIKALSPEVLFWKGHMGQWQEERIKTEDKAIYYHMETGKQALAVSEIRRFWSSLPNNLSCPTETDQPTNDETPHVDLEKSIHREWKADLRIHKPPHGELDEYLHRFLTNLFDEVMPDQSGVLITGLAGTGKTHATRQLYQWAQERGQAIRLTAFTHAACAQLENNAITFASLFGLKPQTDIRKVLAVSSKVPAKLYELRLDWLVVDEISMLPLAYWEVLMVFHHASPRTRIVLVGDFHQLPPIEPQWDEDDRKCYREKYAFSSHNYLDHTDIVPYLLYDRTHRQAGQWLQMSECMRTTDPLLMQICMDPLSVGQIALSDFPMPPPDVPVWRFIAFHNCVRKAINFYCMNRYLGLFPQRPRVRLVLAELWAIEKNRQAEERRLLMDTKKPRPTPPTEEDIPATTTTTAPDRYRPEDFSKVKYKPGHWKYLQNFTYAVGMEVLCRCTPRDEDQPCLTAKLPGEVTDIELFFMTNNRRGVIVAMDTETITWGWLDVPRRCPSLATLVYPSYNNTTAAPASAPATDDSTVPGALTLSHHDFAFAFVPGFCVTTYQSQGETIREHYAVADWVETSKSDKVAYVAVTRGSTSAFLHLLHYREPWTNWSDNGSVRDHVLGELYIQCKRDDKQTYEMDLDTIVEELQAHPQCADCGQPLLLTGCRPDHDRRFKIQPRQGGHPLAPGNYKFVCYACHFKPSKPKH